MLNNPSLLVSTSSWQICCSCTHGHGGARFPCLQALGVQCVCELVRVISDSQAADFSVKYSGSAAALSCFTSQAEQDFIDTARVTNTLLAKFCRFCCFSALLTHSLRSWRDEEKWPQSSQVPGLALANIVFLCL